MMALAKSTPQRSRNESWREFGRAGLVAPAVFTVGPGVAWPRRLFEVGGRLFAIGTRQSGENQRARAFERGEN
jgi:hypothetical protein